MSIVRATLPEFLFEIMPEIRDDQVILVTERFTPRAPMVLIPETDQDRQEYITTLATFNIKILFDGTVREYKVLLDEAARQFEAQGRQWFSTQPQPETPDAL